MLLYYVAAAAGRAQATLLVRRQNLISKGHSGALARRFNSRPPAQPTVILDSTGTVKELFRPAKDVPNHSPGNFTRIIPEKEICGKYLPPTMNIKQKRTVSTSKCSHSEAVVDLQKRSVAGKPLQRLEIDKVGPANEHG